MDDSDKERLSRLEKLAIQTQELLQSVCSSLQSTHKQNEEINHKIGTLMEKNDLGDIKETVEKLVTLQNDSHYNLMGLMNEKMEEMKGVMNERMDALERTNNNIKEEIGSILKSNPIFLSPSVSQSTPEVKTEESKSETPVLNLENELSSILPESLFWVIPLVTLVKEDVHFLESTKTMSLEQFKAELSQTPWSLFPEKYEIDCLKCNKAVPMTCLRKDKISIRCPRCLMCSKYEDMESHIRFMKEGEEVNVEVKIEDDEQKEQRLREEKKIEALLPPELHCKKSLFSIVNKKVCLKYSDNRQCFKRQLFKRTMEQEPWTIIPDHYERDCPSCGLSMSMACLRKDGNSLQCPHCDFVSSGKVFEEGTDVLYRCLHCDWVCGSPNSDFGVSLVSEMTCSSCKRQGGLDPLPYEDLKSKLRLKKGDTKETGPPADKMTNMKNDLKEESNGIDPEEIKSQKEKLVKDRLLDSLLPKYLTWAKPLLSIEGNEVKIQKSDSLPLNVFAKVMSDNPWLVLPNYFEMECKRCEKTVSLIYLREDKRTLECPHCDGIQQAMWFPEGSALWLCKYCDHTFVQQNSFMRPICAKCSSHTHLECFGRCDLKIRLKKDNLVEEKVIKVDKTKLEWLIPTDLLWMKPLFSIKDRMVHTEDGRSITFYAFNHDMKETPWIVVPNYYEVECLKCLQYVNLSCLRKDKLSIQCSHCKSISQGTDIQNHEKTLFMCCKCLSYKEQFFTLDGKNCCTASGHPSLIEVKSRKMKFRLCKGSGSGNSALHTVQIPKKTDIELKQDRESEVKRILDEEIIGNLMPSNLHSKKSHFAIEDDTVYNKFSPSHRHKLHVFKKMMMIYPWMLIPSEFEKDCLSCGLAVPMVCLRRDKFTIQCPHCGSISQSSPTEDGNSLYKCEHCDFVSEGRMGGVEKFPCPYCKKETRIERLPYENLTATVRLRKEPSGQLQSPNK